MSHSKISSILITEDKDMIREMTAETLIEAGYKVLKAANGAECVEICKKDQPDLVLMDIMMPVMDGLQAVEALRKCVSTEKIPIIFLTDLISHSDGFSKLGININDKHYFSLAKPFSIEQLLKKIRFVKDNIAA